MESIQAGSRGPFVALLQSLLNRAGASPRLRVDSDWGPLTDQAFMTVLGARSVIGLQTNPAIWRNLGLTVEIDHPVRRHAQPTDMTCWSASMTMLTGHVQSIGPDSAVLGPGNGLVGDDANVELFARQHGKVIVSRHQSLPVAGLIGILRRGPALILGWGRDRRRPDGTLTNGWGHACVLSGIWSTGDADGLTTLFRVHDPWPKNRGRIWHEFYNGQPGRSMGYGRFGDTIIQ